MLLLSSMGEARVLSTESCRRVERGDKDEVCLSSPMNVRSNKGASGRTTLTPSPNGSGNSTSSSSSSNSRLCMSSGTTGKAFAFVFCSVNSLNLGCLGVS